MQHIAILGATGRMGRTLIRMLSVSGNFTLCGAAVEAGHPLLGQDAGVTAGLDALGVALTSDVAEAVAGCDIAIDFTLPVATSANISACVAQGCGLVLGTTGLDESQLAQLHEAGGTIAVVYARNMSVGVNVLTALARLAAGTMGDDADIEIIESHHRNKIDAPSGTALQIGEAIADRLGRRFDEVAVFDRQGTKGARTKGSIGFSSIRAGSIVGDHTILLAGEEEVLEISHRALDRGAFARGALRAAQWLEGREAGLYSMSDVLGF